jgi:ATP-dependent RNA helicase RhlE
MSQNQRQRALTGFRDGDFTVLVATDIAARGIDVSRVGQVINFDLPSTAEAYTHRIGRTGRAQREGRAVSFIGHDDTAMIKAIERLQGKSIERLTVDGFSMGEKGEEQAPQRQPKPRGKRKAKQQTSDRSPGKKQTRSGNKAKKSSRKQQSGNIFGLAKKGK